MNCAALIAGDVYSWRPLQLAHHAQGKLYFAAIAEFVVYLVPVRRKVCFVKVVKCLKASCTMWIVTALILEQKSENVCAEVHCNPASPVQPHLQRHVYCI